MPVLHLPDMSCGHCRASVEAALTAEVQNLTVDLERRQIRFEGMEAAAAIARLAEIGFDAEEIAP